MNSTLIDLTGKRFGKLLVLKRADSKCNPVMWVCKCDCGNELSIRGGHLREGQKQCRKCQPKNNNITHGLYGHPLYTTWVMMRQRCQNPKSISYPNYGARGIKVCVRWEQFENFILDMGMPPSQLHTLDRINNDGDYEPMNCKWATLKEQQRNTRFNRVLVYNNESKSASEWAEKLSIKVGTILNRLKLGWSVEKTLTHELRELERVIEYNGLKLTVKEWSEKIGIKKATLNSRIYKGWGIEKSLTTKKLRQRK